jgi:hypothetical protein
MSLKAARYDQRCPQYAHIAGHLRVLRARACACAGKHSTHALAAAPRLSVAKGDKGKARVERLTGRAGRPRAHDLLSPWTDALDAVWDEDRGGPRTLHNFISIPTDGNFFMATGAARRTTNGPDA